MNVGDKYGRLTILVERFTEPPSTRPFVWVECECGKVCRKGYQEVKIGNTKSCGCLAREASAKREATHRMSGGPEYNVWKGIKQRCYNTKHTHYASYGGRGIVMCDRWRDSFEAFYEDMGPRPQGQTIDRQDNDKGYDKDNCKWATKKTQSRNTRSNHMVVFDGVEMTLMELSESAVVDYPTLVWRVNQGWDLTRAISQPSADSSKRGKKRNW